MSLRRLHNADWGFESSCFVCEPSNDVGLRLVFEHDDEAEVVQATFTLDRRFSGAPSYVHGGVVLAVLDEAMAWACIAIGGRFATTRELSTCFVQPVRLDRRYGVTAWLEGQEGERLRAAAAVHDGEGPLCVEARATFASLSPARAVDAIGGEAKGDDARFVRSRWRSRHRADVTPAVSDGRAGGTVAAMEHKFEDLKGRAKEASGDLTDDEELKREGQADQASASVKEKIDDAKDKLDDAVDSVKDRFNKR